MNTIETYLGQIPVLSTEEMIEVDRLMIEEYGIILIQMMENAGRCLAIVAMREFLKSNFSDKQVIILVGTGGNGGGALVCARRLHNWGVRVSVYLSAAEGKMTPIPKHQLDSIQQMNIPVYSGLDLPQNSDGMDLIIDGIIGYSIQGDPYGLPKQMIEWANTQSAPTLSLDTPSGLDLTTGTIHKPTIKATATLTLALPKEGLFKEQVQDYRGNLFLGDISVPPQLYAEPSLKLEVSSDLFVKGDVIRIPFYNKMI